MPLNEFQKANFRHHIHSRTQIVDPETGAPIANPMQVATISLIFDGAGGALTTGEKGYVRLPWAATIKAAILLSKEEGDLVVDIWRGTFANHPATNADSITGSSKPTLSAADSYSDEELSGWTVDLDAGDILTFNIDSASEISLASMILEIEHA